MDKKMILFLFIIVCLIVSHYVVYTFGYDKGVDNSSDECVRKFLCILKNADNYNDYNKTAETIVQECLYNKR